MIQEKKSQPHSGTRKGEPSVRIIAPTALDTKQLQVLLCRWWEDRKELWDDQSNRLDRADSARG
jgi:hypothetical protein